MDLWKLALSVTLAALGCAPAASAAPPASGAASPAPPPPSTPALREGIVLAQAANPRLHPLDGALLVSTDTAADKSEGRRLYLARGDALVPQPAHTLPAAVAGEGLALAGSYPAHVFAIATGRDADGFTTRLLRREAAAWATISLPAAPADAVWWSNRLVGLVRDPAVVLGYKLVRLDAPGPDLEIPAGEGPACDTFYAKGGRGFPKLAVQPRGLSSAARQLFLLGMGCDGNVASAIWAPGAASPRIDALDERMFFDGAAGAVVGLRASDLWYFRRAMRPASLAALWHHDGARWSKVPWPGEDPDVESIDVDAGGVLWAAIDGKLYHRSAARWIERPLPAGCEARYVAATEKGSLWIACLDAVARLSNL